MSGLVHEEGPGLTRRSRISLGSDILHGFCAVCGTQNPIDGSPCILAEAANRRRGKRAKATLPFSIWWYVRSDTHVYDYDGGAWEFAADDKPIKVVAARILTLDEIAHAKLVLRECSRSSGRIRAVRVIVRKRCAR